MNVGSKAPSKEKRSFTLPENIIKKTVEKTNQLEELERLKAEIKRLRRLVIKAENIIKRPTRWKCNQGRSHIQDNIDWLADYEKEMGI